MLDAKNKSKEQHLYHLYNNLGNKDLKVSHMWKDKNNNTKSTKHIRYEEIMHHKRDEYIKKAGMTRKEFIDKVNQRTIIDNEIIIDIDEALEENLTLKDTAEVVNKILQQEELKDILYKYGYKGHKAYKSGGKGYHFHIYCKTLSLKSSRERRKLRENIINACGGDVLIKGGHTIQLEYAKHWRTGNIKEEVNFDE